MENYLIALACYALFFIGSHFLSRKKSTQKSELSADYILSNISSEEVENEVMETKSVA
ncbi:hypothetical protein [Ascidiimonas sp. W6]|uniref:hypothetical protein n=1 Tax=Ascidiimonas meishanensis TaxID=3128903 RepID=UPI0030EBD311